MSTPYESAPSEELTALHAQVRHYESKLTELDAVIAQRDAMIEHLQEQVRLLLARRFAPSSEKMPDGQLGLFNEAEATEAEESTSAPDATEVAAYRRGTPKRAPIPEALPRIDIEHRLPEDERTCPHHGVELERFAEVVSEQLDIIPMQVRVLRHVRGKYRLCRARHRRYYIDAITMSGTTGPRAILSRDCRPVGERLDPSTRHSLGGPTSC